MPSWENLEPGVHGPRGRRVTAVRVGVFSTRHTRPGQSTEGWDFFVTTSEKPTDFALDFFAFCGAVLCRLPSVSCLVLLVQRSGIPFPTMVAVGRAPRGLALCAAGAGVVLVSVWTWTRQRQRQSRAMRRLCARLPKVELHAHLHGSARLSTIAELAPSMDDASTLAVVSEDDDRSLESCFAIFGVIHRAVTTKDAVKRIATEARRDDRPRP